MLKEMQMVKSRVALKCYNEQIIVNLIIKLKVKYLFIIN